MTQAEIKSALKARGFDWMASGLDGAVRAFQRSAGLADDGDVGPKTRAALKAPIVKVLPPARSVREVLTVANLRRIEPFARADILAALAASAAEIEAAGITSPLRLAHFLAQVGHETAGLARLEESLSYSAARLVEVWPSRFPSVAAATPYARNPVALANKVYGGRLGNKAAGDGWRYRGGGGLMTTGAANYAEAGFAANPDHVRSLDGFLGPALLYWRTRGCSALADRDDVEGVSRKINGGTIGLADRRTRLANAKRVLLAA